LANLPAALPALHAVSQQLEQILVNQITNGLHFTPEGGIVTVKVRVIDTGIGIPPEEL